MEKHKITLPRIESSYAEFIENRNARYALNYTQFYALGLSSPIGEESLRWVWSYYSGDVINAKQHIYLQGLLFDKW